MTCFFFLPPLPYFTLSYLFIPSPSPCSLSFHCPISLHSPFFIPSSSTPCSLSLNSLITLHSSFFTPPYYLSLHTHISLHSSFHLPPLSPPCSLSLHSLISLHSSLLPLLPITSHFTLTSLFILHFFSPPLSLFPLTSLSHLSSISLSFLVPLLQTPPLPLPSPTITHLPLNPPLSQVLPRRIRTPQTHIPERLGGGGGGEGSS